MRVTKPVYSHIREPYLVLLIFLVSLGIRLIYLNEVGASALLLINFVNGTDMENYLRWGLEISRGAWVGEKAFSQGPLFPYVMAVIFKLSGENIYTACLLQVSLGAATTVLIYGISRVAFGRGVAIISSLISCFYGSFIFYCGVLLSETLGVFLVSSAIFTLILSFNYPRRSLFFLSGCLLGFACLTRPIFLSFALFIFFTLLIMKRIPRRISLAALFFTGIFLVIIPVTARNLYVSGKFVLISENALMTFRIANSYGSPVMNFTYPEAPLMPLRSPSFWNHQLKKAIFFWYGYEVPQNVNYYLFMGQSGVLRKPLFPFWMVAPLAVTGLVAWMCLAKTKNPVLALFILSFYLSTSLFIINSRYRLPVMVGLIPFAGYFVSFIYETIRCKEFRTSFKYLLLTLSFLLMMLPREKERIRATDHAMLAKAMIRKGLYHSAEEELKKSLFLEKDPYTRRELKSLIEKLQEK